MSIKQKQPPVIPDRLELVVRGGRIVTPEGIQCADLGVLRGKIVQIAPEISEEADATLDAEGAYVFPGIMDAHVHFNEPGRADWEGLASGSAALAAGGGTCFFDMPLNSEPPVLDSAGLRVKRALAEERSCTDFALWGGLVPGNLNQLAGLKSAGAIGVKAFMFHEGHDPSTEHAFREIARLTSGAYAAFDHSAPGRLAALLAAAAAYAAGGRMALERQAREGGEAARLLLTQMR